MEGWSQVVIDNNLGILVAGIIAVPLLAALALGITLLLDRIQGPEDEEEPDAGAPANGRTEA
jgi:hypothetical protein